MAGVLAPLLAYGATMHVNFTLMHGYIPSTPAVDMAQAFHPSLPGAIDACAAIAACAAVTFRPEDEHSAGSVHTGAWYSYKRYPPSGAALPSVWPDPSWRTYVRAGPRPSARVPRACDAHECAGIRPPCAPSSPAQWGWPYRAASASSVPRPLGFVHAGSRAQLDVHWSDGAHDSWFLTLLPGTRQEVLSASGALWRVRRPPPDDRLVAEHLAGRALVQHCACAAQRDELGLRAERLRSVANANANASAGAGTHAGAGADAAAGGAREADTEVPEAARRANGAHAARDGEGRVCSEADSATSTGDGTSQTPAAARERPGGGVQPNLDLHLFNSAPFDARLVRARFEAAGGAIGAEPSLCDAGELGSGLDTLVTGLRLGDVLVACAVHRADGEADCNAPLLVHRLADVRLEDCANDARGAVGEMDGAAQDDGAARRQEELRQLDGESAQLRELLRSAQAMLGAAEHLHAPGAKARSSGAAQPLSLIHI